MQLGRESPPTYGSDDGTTEEEGGGHVPVAGEVLCEAADIQAGLHCGHHFLQRRIYAYTLLPTDTSL